MDTVQNDNKLIGKSSDYTWAYAAGFSVREVSRTLLEKTLYMRAQSYLAQVRSRMLSETLFEVDMRRRKSDEYAQEMARQKVYSEQQKQRLEEANAELEQRVTERTRELLVHKERAERASLAKSRFLSMISHELLTPINTIQGMADLLTDATKTEPQLSWIGAQQKSCQHLMDIIENILLFTDDEDQSVGYKGLAGKSFAPRLVVEQVTNSYQVKAEQKGLRFTLAYSRSALPELLAGDARHLQIILKSLVSNAVKFTQQGEIVINVDWHANNMRHGSMHLSVRDTGIGLSSSDLATLFQPLQQIEVGLTRTYQGLGMGLSLCHSLVERMGGTVHVDSTLGKGSLFQVSLPCMVVDQDAAFPRLAKTETDCQTNREPAERVVSSEQKAVSESLPKILLVDDCEDNIFLMKALLVKIPCQLYLAFSGEEAVNRVLGDGPFNIIIMDIQMPVMDGLTAMREIRSLEQDREWSRQTILVVSANGLDSDREAGFSAGCDDYLTKPVRKQVLHEQMSRWIPISESGYSQSSGGIVAPMAE
ncbi:MAG: response regulator [Magnetococcales bacterium]|nr:response regulator [Magnetococcales bacterium]MBF0116984.1 response regulator [Magnetococcales bacterium]